MDLIRESFLISVRCLGSAAPNHPVSQFTSNGFFNTGITETTNIISRPYSPLWPEGQVKKLFSSGDPNYFLSRVYDLGTGGKPVLFLKYISIVETDKKTPFSPV